MFEEGVTPLMLQLLGYAICEMKSQPSTSPQKSSKKDKDKEKDKSKSKDKDKDKDKDKTEGNIESLEVFSWLKCHRITEEVWLSRKNSAECKYVGSLLAEASFRGNMRVVIFLLLF